LLPEEINLPVGVEIFQPNFEYSKPLDNSAIKSIFDNSEFAEIIHNHGSLLVINDHFRTTPSARLLGIIHELYGTDHRIGGIVIATGTHPAPNEEQIDILTGGYHTKLNCPIIIHDSKSADLKYIGTSTRGTEFKINPVIFDYEYIIAINGVEPHFFAGYTGGIKSIVPGMAAYGTIESNHSWALDENSYPTSLDDNPVQLDLWESTKFIDQKLIGVQMVNIHNDIYHLSIGDLKSSFRKAVDFSSKIFTHQLNEKVDVVVSVVYPPLDDNLYQAQKGIENTRSVLKEGGEMILFALCEGGIGNTAFYNTILAFDNPDDVIATITRDKYKFGDHKVMKFATLVKENKFSLVTELSDKEIKSVFADRIEIEFLEYYLNELSNENKSIILVLDSGTLSLEYLG
jgi:nickel-dependent lactate racemase